MTEKRDVNMTVFTSLFPLMISPYSFPYGLMSHSELRFKVGINCRSDQNKIHQKI